MGGSITGSGDGYTTMVTSWTILLIPVRQLNELIELFLLF